eukprot:gnl/TRDRNA2_/TRDRNA2_188245_c0_seq1.p2 gnl/TRDRNA2_/TRDRNA2_188245_c0~~gnl/TRDRNA2_/TRDRNA2_188245_c0_seq1.p2  ORF type:complete len:223 (+),score=58.55 gnl/TRDRNA2_/TRDRNA2_188245_c0_seq1:24-671(+)
MVKKPKTPAKELEADVESKAKSVKVKVSKLNEHAKSVKVSPPERAKLIEEALDSIKAGIAEPDAQRNGDTFIPADWHTKYKPVLGHYRKFCKAQSDVLKIVEDDTGRYVIRLANADADSQALKPHVPKTAKGTSSWQEDLVKAWETYCRVVPKGERKFSIFINALPKSALEASAFKKKKLHAAGCRAIRIKKAEKKQRSEEKKKSLQAKSAVGVV